MESKLISKLAYTLRASYKLGNPQVSWHLKCALMYATTTLGNAPPVSNRFPTRKLMGRVSPDDELSAARVDGGSAIDTSEEQIAAEVECHAIPSGSDLCRPIPICLYNEIWKSQDEHTQTTETMVTELEVRHLFGGYAQQRDAELSQKLEEYELKSRQVISSLQLSLETTRQQLVALTASAPTELAQECASRSEPLRESTTNPAGDDASVYESAISSPLAKFSDSPHASFLAASDFHVLRSVSRLHASLAVELDAQ